MIPGTDLILPRQAAAEIGFSVMDGGSITAPGTIVTAVSCQRLNANSFTDRTQSGPAELVRTVRAVLSGYGNDQIGRGNAVTDNFSTLPRPGGWDAGSDLGQRAVDCPLSATFGGIVLSDVYV